MVDLNMSLSNQSQTECKGLYWRASTNTFVSSHGSIELRKSLRLLKRMSCTGCIHCGWVFEYISELVNRDDENIIDHIEQGKIYTYTVHTSQGYYELYPEIDCFEFVEIEEKKGE